MANNRKNFFYNYYQWLVYAFLSVLFLLLAMVILILYQVNHRPVPTFIAVAPKNKQMALTSFPEPNYLPNTILKWAGKAAVASYNFNFVNYDAQIKNAAPYYTERGWSGYRSSINNVINEITAKKLFVNSVVSGEPVISWQGTVPGQGYLWRIQMPFLVTYQTAETVSRESYYVIMTVVKVPPTLDPTGMGIDQFVMR